MAVRQTRIYVPNNPPFDGNLWAETLMARVITPLVQHATGLKWFWFIRYRSPNPEFADSDGSKIPQDYFDDNPCRSIRFRFEIEDALRVQFEAQGDGLIQNEGCWNADWRAYDALGELGGHRFCGDIPENKPSQERADLLCGLLCSLSKVVLHSIVAADSGGRFRAETNHHNENPNHSTFDSLHHLFCNITAVPLYVQLFGPQPFVRTDWMPDPPPGLNLIASQPISF